MKLTNIYANWILESTPAGWEDYNFKKVFIDADYQNDGTHDEIANVFDKKIYVSHGQEDDQSWDDMRERHTNDKNVTVWRDKYNGKILEEVLRPHVETDVFIMFKPQHPQVIANQLEVLKDYPGRVFIIIDNTSEWATKRDLWKEWGAQQIIDILHSDRIVGAGFIPTKVSVNDRMFILYDKNKST